VLEKWEETDLRNILRDGNTEIPNSPQRSLRIFIFKLSWELFMNLSNLFYAKEEIMELRKFLWSLK